MKKVLKMLTVLVLVFSVLGCSNEKKNKEVVASEEITVYLVRHGKTMLNTTDLAQGWADAPLTPQGKEVVEALGKGLKDVDFDSAYSSDSGRSIETAETILANNGQKDLVEKLQKDKGFREFNYGSFEGFPNAKLTEIAENYFNMSPEEYEEKMASQGFAETAKDWADSTAAADKENFEEGKNWPAEDYDTVQKKVCKEFRGYT